VAENRVPGWLSGLLVGGAFCALLWLERRRPLRRSVEPKLRRNARNLAVAARFGSTMWAARRSTRRTCARIKEATAALLSWDGKPVDPFYLRLAKEGTLVLVGPKAVDLKAPAAARPPDSLMFPDGLPKRR
jgi:hypothetical protein